MSEKDRELMARAIEIAKRGVESNAGGPFGAVVAHEGIIIGEGWNSVTSTNDPTSHAEINAIRAACESIGSFQLTDCVLYTSCEPCPMCLGAIYWARPSRVYFACNREDAAKIGFDDQFIYDEIGLDINARRIETRSLMRDEAIEVFKLWDEKEDKVPY